MNLGDKKFSIFTGLFQVLLVVLFAFCVDYGDLSGGNSPATFYSYFQDIHVMIFIGFGFLMTFLKKYTFGAVGYNMFISALVIQWATLMRGWMGQAFGIEHAGAIKIDITSMINADFAAAAVLITFGAVLGKVSRLQLAIIGIFEIIFYYINECIIIKYLHISDAGGSILVHMFGAYFGIAVTRMIFSDDIEKDNEKEGSNYHSDVFAMIGTIFLWMFWPSFNSGLLGPGPQQHRAVINTYFALASCCVTVFVVSPLVDKKQRLDMVHVQNATLAGGVAVGTACDMIIGPWAALLIGVVAGILSTLGYAYITPALLDKLNVHDTCGVHNLHGMPALLAAIAGAIAASTATLDTYGGELFNIWSARTPATNTTLYKAAVAQGITVGADGMNRSASMQGLMQAIAMVVTLAVAIISGLLTGLIVRFIDSPSASQLYDDGDYWIVPGEEVNEEEGKETELLRITAEA